MREGKRRVRGGREGEEGEREGLEIASGVGRALCGAAARAQEGGVGVCEGERGFLDDDGRGGEDGHGLVNHLLPHLLYELLFLGLEKRKKLAGEKKNQRRIKEGGRGRGRMGMGLCIIYFLFLKGRRKREERHEERGEREGECERGGERGEWGGSLCIPYAPLLATCVSPLRLSISRFSVLRTSFVARFAGRNSTRNPR